MQQKTIRQRLTATAATVAVGAGMLAAGVVGAAPAQAVSYGYWDNCRWVGNSYVCSRTVNYNWWEELWGKRDYTQHKVILTR